MSRIVRFAFRLCRCTLPECRACSSFKMRFAGTSITTAWDRPSLRLAASAAPLHTTRFAVISHRALPFPDFPWPVVFALPDLVLDCLILLPRFSASGAGVFSCTLDSPFPWLYFTTLVHSCQEVFLRFSTQIISRCFRRFA